MPLAAGVTAPGGWTTGWFIGAGVSVTPVFAVEGELSSTGLMSAREPSRYGMTFNEQRRDRLISLVTRISAVRLGAMHLEPVGGIVITLPQSWSQTEYLQYWLTPREVRVVGPKQQNDLPAGVGVTFGCDARIGGRRVTAVPSFRLAQTRVAQGNGIHTPDPGGYPKWTVRVGAGIRVGF